MTSSATAIHSRCDAAIQAIEKLQDAEKILVNYEADSNKLQQDVASLRLEKQSLAKKFVDMKQELRELEGGITETQSHTHVYTTPAFGRRRRRQQVLHDREHVWGHHRRKTFRAVTWWRVQGQDWLLPCLY